MTKRLPRWPARLQRAGLSRSTVYALMKAGELPMARLIGACAVGWPEDEIERFINTRRSGGSERPQR